MTGEETGKRTLSATVVGVQASNGAEAQDQRSRAGGGPATGLVAAIGAAGIDPSDTVFIAGPREAMILKTKSGPNFDHQVLMSLGLPAKTVVAVAPAGIASGYQGPPEIDTSREAVLHFESASPGEIVSTPGASASPTKSIFQSYLIAIRVRAECAWAAAPGAVQVINGVNW